MLDHFTFNVPAAQYDAIVAWYLAALAPLGYTKQLDYPGHACGLGASPSSAAIWIGVSRDGAAAAHGFHLAFKAEDHETVERFYKAAIEAGGKDNGAPGPRDVYGPNYYGAFVLDPLGNNVEVVDKIAH
ncbi:hypothetical protein PMIN06_005840 [Paraphaeosphaeria minitans]|uniref:Glyoxalase bleomycin resistance protein dioxygenase n=1 Tax=Paraphaeosphaeria minitans TaxID=565426 RepID=A0A9P6G942_9PLEO|nr:glyoxalase bleomycin resistance protein dioxygenase [Paraphaeosphaeria minitans]